MRKATILIIDDHPMIRSGLRTCFEGAQDMVVVAEAQDAPTALSAIKGYGPDVVFLDLQVPGAHGLELCFRIVHALPRGHVIVFSAYLNPMLLKTCVDVGVAGYLMKNTETFDPVEAVRHVMAGGKAFDAQVVNAMSALLSNSGPEVPTLSFRELQILRLMGEGFSNVEIAETLNLSPNTVKSYAKNLMQKMDARNRTEAAVRGFELGII